MISRIVNNSVPCYNRFNLLSEIADRAASRYSDREDVADAAFGIVLFTVRYLEDLGVVESFEGTFARMLKVQDWSKMNFFGEEDAH